MQYDVLEWNAILGQIPKLVSLLSCEFGLGCVFVEEPGTLAFGPTHTLLPDLPVVNSYTMTHLRIDKLPLHESHQ